MPVSDAQELGNSPKEKRSVYYIMFFLNETKFKSYKEDRYDYLSLYTLHT